MKKCVFAIVIVLALLLSACIGKPQPASETSPSLLPSKSQSVPISVTHSHTNAHAGTI